MSGTIVECIAKLNATCHVVCCTCPSARGLLHVVCRMLHAAGMRIGAYRTLEVAYHMLHCWMLHAVYAGSRMLRRTSQLRGADEV